MSDVQFLKRKMKFFNPYLIKMPQLLAVLNEENYTYILVYVYSLGMFLLVKYCNI